MSRAIPIADAASDELEALLRAYGRLVYRIAYSVLRHPADAEEAAQETFLRVWRYRKSWPKVDDWRAWLARIAWRVAVGRRRASAEVSMSEAVEAVRELQAAGRSPEQIAAERQMMALLERLIAALPRELRDPLTLSTLEEMSSPDIAAVLDIPEATVRTRVFRARQLLHEKLLAVLEGKYGR